MSGNSGREQFQRLAEAKFADASTLAANGRYGNAFYLAGYAVEIGLKACIARQIVAETIPDKRFIIDVHTHDYRKLAGLAGLSRLLADKERDDPIFSAYWGIVAEWNPEARYAGREAIECQLLLKAIGDERNGVLPWIRTVW